MISTLARLGGAGLVCAGAGSASIRHSGFLAMMFLASGRWNIAILTWRQLQSVAHLFHPGFPMRIAVVFGLAMLAASLTGAAHADVRMSGTFVADASCPATQAIKNGKNPGNVSTDAGQSYQLLAGNKDAPTHYLILVPGADPDRRWVKVSCGHLSGSSAATLPATPAGRASRRRQENPNMSSR
ncbi:hypothetical protein [Mesorhizobium sp. ORM16]|uniref:hypothetical protein n=1 Tax=Mesorhizobium sp. ORM16 TaxID=3376989 RepID=UPI00385781E9